MRKKKILIYAHYYVPDVASTGQIIHELAEGLIDYFDITIICVVPSYTGMIDEYYRKKKLYKENCDGITILRIRVPEFSKRSKVSRIRNLLCYYFNAKKTTRMLRNEPFDYVFSISQPPIMGGLLGVYGKRILRTNERKHPKLIYNIQDFNPEQIIAVGFFHNKPILRMMLTTDKHSCMKSDLVITVGRDLVDTLCNRFEGSVVPKYVMINNWINEKEIFPLDSNNLEVVKFKKEFLLENKFIFMYSGNLGLYYDLEGIIKVIEKFKGIQTPSGLDVAFVFIGEGSTKEKLVKIKKERSLDNVFFIPYQNKDRLIFSLNAADVHLCVNAKGIKGVSCPSKFYGIAGVGKPVLGVLEKGSEVEMLISNIKCGLVSEPKDYTSLENNIRWFIDNSSTDELSKMGKRGYEYLIKYLSKELSINKYYDAINRL